MDSLLSDAKMTTPRELAYIADRQNSGFCCRSAVACQTRCSCQRCCPHTWRWCIKLS